MYRSLIFPCILFFILITGCSSNKWDIDISGVQIEQEFSRFDKDLFSLSYDSIWDYVPIFEQKYGAFYDLYNQAIINIGSTNQMDYNDKLYYFITDPYIAETQAAVNRLFVNELFKDKIYNAFRRYHYYFPNKSIPNIYTHNSGFNQSLVVDSGFVSISLDKYLGSSSKYYKMLQTPLYLRYNMHPAKIPVDVMYSWGLTEFIYNSKNDILSSQMIYYGKMHVFIDAMLPNTADTIKWGFTEQKMNWCKKNERLMWMYLIENKLLFNSSFKEIKRFIDDGPFTTPFSKESPARTGQWLGYQIVKSYLKNNPKVSLQELMQIDDYQKILNDSKYKP